MTRKKSGQRINYSSRKNIYAKNAWKELMMQVNCTNTGQLGTRASIAEQATDRGLGS
ncbi:MAG: hypothetical protein ACJ702_02310 [Nitrososphaeraceae archaeon]